MKLNKILKNSLLVVFACLALNACATKKVSTGQMQGDVYTGTDTVEYWLLVFQTEYFSQLTSQF